MKKKYKAIILVAVLSLIGFWWLYKAQFNDQIDHKVFANVYKDGISTSDTSIIILGQRSNNPFNEDNMFEGKLIIPSYEITYGGTALITRMDGYNMYNLYYAQVEPFVAQEISAPLLINEEMTKLALMSTDGIVIATSDELYEIFIKHVKLQVGGGTLIEHIDKIPIIE